MLISEAIVNHKSMVELPKETTFDDVRRVIRVYMRKHPEIFWFSHQYKYDVLRNILALKYNFTKDKADFYKEEIVKVVAEDFQLERLLSMDMPDVQKVAYIYKWLANYTNYNEYSSFNQTIYSVLVNRNSVCTGYAKTAQYLLYLLGVESQLVFGKFLSDTTGNGRHCWNIVKIDGVWYHVDFCLADQSLAHLLNEGETPILRNGILWNYFGVSTAKILKNRTIELVETHPKCDESITSYPKIQLLTPAQSLICCKSDSGTSAKVFLDAHDKHAVVKVPRSGDFSQLRHESTLLGKLSLAKHVIKSLELTNEGLKLGLLTPWSEMLNSHYYNPSEAMLMDIIVQLTNGLIECRENGITYSDIHYNNVFVSKDGVYKWGDFGIAYQKQSGDSLPVELIGEDGIALGGRWFMSPETYHKKVFSEASAIYSLAMMAYFVMNDMRPPLWTDESHKEEALVQRLTGTEIPKPLFVDSYKDLWNTIRACLSFDAEKRPQSFEYMLSELCEIEVLNIDENNSLSPMLDLAIDDESYLVDLDNDECLDDITASTLPFDNTGEVSNMFESDEIATTRGGSWGDGGIHDSDSFACTAFSGFEHVSPPKGKTPNNSPAQSECQPQRTYPPNTYGAVTDSAVDKPSQWKRIFGKKGNSEYINASAYAPAVVVPHKHFLVRVFLHKPEEASTIDQTVRDVDKTAVKKANKPLDIPIKKGDNITVQLSMSGDTRIDEPIQNVVWRSRYVECDFACEVYGENVNSIIGKAIIIVNTIPAGDLKFTIEVAEQISATVYTPIESRRYSKIFISYSHADEAQVRGFAECCRALGTDYFFDRHTLRAGDMFKDKILDYINNADLFVLCWSKNAAESEWVQIEREHALSLIRDGKARLSIYPLSLKPEAPLPLDMSDKYNFGTL